MKQLVVNHSDVVRYASKNVVVNGSDMLTATAKAVCLATLKARLMRGEICKWVYRKVSGEIRVCTGTLFADCCKNLTVGGHTPKKVFGQFAYIEIFPDGTMSWRSFRESNFVGTIES